MTNTGTIEQWQHHDGLPSDWRFKVQSDAIADDRFIAAELNDEGTVD